LGSRKCELTALLNLFSLFELLNLGVTRWYEFCLVRFAFFVLPLTLFAFGFFFFGFTLVLQSSQ